MKGDSHWDMSHMIQMWKRPVLCSSVVQTVYLDGNVQPYEGWQSLRYVSYDSGVKRPVLGSLVVQIVHLDGNVQTY